MSQQWQRNGAFRCQYTGVELNLDDPKHVRTVRELATGTYLRFEALGAVAPRGVPGEWELFEASIG